MKVSQIEFSLVEKDVLYGLKQGNSVLTQLNTEMSVENVEKLMGETADAIAYQKAWIICKRSTLLSADTIRASQEVDELLQSRMSAEEEDAVQNELLALQEQLVSHLCGLLCNYRFSCAHLFSRVWLRNLAYTCQMYRKRTYQLWSNRVRFKLLDVPLRRYTLTVFLHQIRCKRLHRPPLWNRDLSVWRCLPK